MLDDYIPPPNAKRHAAGRTLLIEEYGAFCFKCLAPPGHGDHYLTLDHIIPIARGGFDFYANWQLLCLRCNVKKGTHVIDYRPGTRHLDIIGTRPLQRMEDRVLRRKRPPTDASAPEREVLTIAQAASRLGIPVAEVWRRIKTGVLRSEQYERPQGLYCRVILDTAEPPADQEAATPAIVERLMDKLDEHDVRIADLTAQVTQLATQAGEYKGQMVINGIQRDIQQKRAEQAEGERDAARAEVERLKAEAGKPWWRKVWG